MYILTGGAGFIGSAFLAKLNAEGIENVLVVDDLGIDDKWKNLSGKKFRDYLHKDQFLDLVASDVFDEPVQAVIHLGACSSTLEQNAEYMLQNNYRYTRILAEWALERSVRFIYASSAATYGEGAEGFSDEDQVTANLKPLNVYAFSKQLFDQWAISSGAIENMVGLKFFNVFGPNEYHKGEMTSVIYKAFHQIREQGIIKLFKSYRPDYQDGEQKRDFVYVKDTVDTMWWFINQPTVNGIFNLGTGTARSWKDLAVAIFKALNLPQKIEFIEMPEPMRDKYQYFTQADLNKLRSVGCNIQFSSLEDTIADYVKQYLLKNLAIY